MAFWMKFPSLIARDAEDATETTPLAVTSIDEEIAFTVDDEHGYELKKVDVQIGEAEAVDMIAAMSTGHDGSLSTGHANSPRGAINRLETMHIASSGFPLSAVREQIAEAVEIIVQLKRFPDGHRRLTEISEIVGIRNEQIEINTIYRLQENGLLEKTGELRNKTKLGMQPVSGSR